MSRDEVDLSDLLGPLSAPETPELRIIGVSTLTGSATKGDSSHGIGNDKDFALLNRVRLWSDVVLVGAGTARAENYFGVRTTHQQREERIRNGQAAVPPIAVVSQSMEFDTSTQLFHDTLTPPLILVPEADINPERAAELESVGAIIVPCGDGTPPEIVSALRSRGLQRIVCEGGPSMFEALLRHALVDIIHMTIAPFATFPVTVPLFPRTDPDDERNTNDSVDREFALDHIESDPDSFVFTRYRRVSTGN